MLAKAALLLMFVVSIMDCKESPPNWVISAAKGGPANNFKIVCIGSANIANVKLATDRRSRCFGKVVSDYNVADSQSWALGENQTIGSYLSLPFNGAEGLLHQVRLPPDSSDAEQGDDDPD